MVDRSESPSGRRAGVVVLAVVAVVVLSGCSVLLGDEPLQYSAEPVAICDGGLSATGYSLDHSEWRNNSRAVEVAGSSRELRTDSHMKVYVRDDTSASGGDGTKTGGIVVLSTPKAEEAGRSLNPVGTWSPDRIVDELASDLDQYGALENVQRTGTDSARLLDTGATVTRFEATGQSDGESHEVTVHVTRVEDDGDFVILGAVHERGDTTERERIESLFGCLQHGPPDRPAPSDVTTADRSLDSDSVAPGGDVSVTLTVEFDHDHSSVSIQDGWTGPVSAGDIDSVTVGGTEVDPFFSNANDESMTVALQDVEAGQSIVVTYTVTVDSDATGGATVEFTGRDDADVTAGSTETDFGSDTVFVSAEDGDGADGGDDDGDNVDAPDDDAPVDLADGRRYYVGQTLERDDGVSPDETLDLVHPDGSSSLQFADSTGTVTIDTTGLSEGEYTLQGEDGDDIATFRLIQQQIRTFAFDTASVSNQGSDTEATLAVETNRRPTVHYLTATLDGESVDATTLQSMVGTGTVVDDETLRIEGTNADEFRVDFTDVPAGTLNLTTTSPDTPEQASTTIEVESDQ